MRWCWSSCLDREDGPREPQARFVAARAVVILGLLLMDCSSTASTVPLAVSQPSASAPSLPPSPPPDPTPGSTTREHRVSALGWKLERAEPVRAPGSDSSLGSPSPSTSEVIEQTTAKCRREAAEYARHWQRLSCLEVTLKFESTRAQAETWARDIGAGTRSADEAGQECLDALAKRFGDKWVQDGKRDASEIEQAKEKACLAERAVGASRDRPR
jgi:hypothetical protein